MVGENSASKKMRELNKTFMQSNYPAIPEKIRGLTDGKKEEE